MKAALGEFVERALAPQERFDALRARASRGGRLVDLAYPNLPGPPHERVASAFRAALEDPRTSLQYTPYGGATVTRRLVAGQIEQRLGVGVPWRQVVLTPGAMAALAVTFRAVAARPGRDEVVVVTPCWMDYPLYLEQLGLRPVRVPLRAETLRLDVDRIREALTPRTGAIVLSQPGNPTGLLHSPRELDDLAAALLECPADEPPLWISDECHRDHVLDPAAFVSPIARYAECCVVYSFGKALGVQGERLGCVAVSPRVGGAAELARLLERLCRSTGTCTPGALVQHAVRSLLDHRPDLAGLARRRARALEALDEGGFRVVPSDGTWFLYPWAPGGDDRAFAEELARSGVLVLPSEVFWDAGHFRIALTASEEDLDLGLRALRAAGAASGAARR